jgi:hypothetical protein
MKTCKKTIFCLIILSSILFMPACRKGFKCDCTKNNGTGYVEMPEFNRTDAKNYCDKLSEASKAQGESGCVLSKM